MTGENKLTLNKDTVLLAIGSFLNYLSFPENLQINQLTTSKVKDVWQHEISCFTPDTEEFSCVLNNRFLQRAFQHYLNKCVLQERVIVNSASYDYSGYLVMFIKEEETVSIND